MPLEAKRWGKLLSCTRELINQLLKKAPHIVIFAECLGRSGLFILLDKEIALRHSKRLHNFFLGSSVTEGLSKLYAHHFHFNVCYFVLLVFEIKLVGYIQPKEKETDKLQEKPHSETR